MKLSSYATCFGTVFTTNTAKGGVKHITLIAYESILQKRKHVFSLSWGQKRWYLKNPTIFLGISWYWGCTAISVMPGTPGAPRGHPWPWAWEIPSVNDTLFGQFWETKKWSLNIEETEKKNSIFCINWPYGFAQPGVKRNGTWSNWPRRFQGCRPWSSGVMTTCDMLHLWCRMKIHESQQFWCSPVVLVPSLLTRPIHQDALGKPREVTMEVWGVQTIERWNNTEVEQCK